jgi:hypothetical protein
VPIDSTASLLFKIGADSDDAEGNIQRFRTLLSKDLGDLKGEFGDWAEEVFGNLGTVQGAMTAATAAAGAAAVALAAVMNESAEAYAKYVGEVERGSRVTGISIEQMSGLHFMAEETSTSYDALVTGLTRFASTIVKASEGGEQQSKAFQRLHISQEQVKAGEKDMMPLLELVADRFKGMGSQVEKTAIARDLFGRGGAELVRILNMGSQGIKDFEAECKKLGQTIHTQDVIGVEQYNASLKALEAQHKSLELAVGKSSLPLKAWTETAKGAAAATAVEAFYMLNLKTALIALVSPVTTFMALQTMFRGNMQALREETGRLAKALVGADNGGGGEGGGVGGAAVKTKESFTGLTDLLEEVTAKTLETGGEQGRLEAQFDGLDKQLAKVYGEYQRLHAAGKLSAEDAAAQAAALGPLSDAFKALKAALEGQADSKQFEAVQRAGEQLEELVLRQGEQTLEVKNRLLDMDVAHRRETMREERTDTATNLAWLAAYERTERQKITDDKIAEIEKANNEIAQKTRAFGERSYEQQRADLNREMDALIEANNAKKDKIAGYNDQVEAERTAGLKKIDADEKAAYDTQIARLDEQLERINREHQTHGQQIASEYQADVVKFTAAEEKKTLAAVAGEANRANIQRMFQAIREGLYTKEQQDLQQLHNSTGWQGVFGDKFATTIRGDEALAKEWATSSNQSLLMVRAAMESLNEMSQKAFEQMAQGMGAGIAHAIMYKQSVGEAMKAALAATLESLAGQAYGQAIYSLALGFLDLAEGNEAGAVQAFTAAAIFATVGTAAALVGRGVAPAQGTGGGAGGSGSAGGAGIGAYGANTSAMQRNAQSSSQVGATAASGGGTHVTVNVQGHLVGWNNIGELTSALNDAVLNQDQTLTATNTKTGVVVQQ